MGDTAQHRLTVLMFTDLVDSSALKTRMGDLGYADSVARPHNAIFRKILSAIEGAQENNYTGDGFLATFARASDAVEAALRFQEAMRSHAWAVVAPKTRVGIHVGEVALLEGPEAGKMLIASHAADMCARLMGLGGGGQILLTRHAFDDGRQYVMRHPPVEGGREAPALEWRAHGRYRFKGKDDDPLEVFEVGAKGSAPLVAPKDSEKAHRVLAADEEELLGWRPAAGLDVPRRDGWTLERKLGAGGFGEVWLARHEKTKERRVFKFCFDALRLRSFRRELTLFRLLREVLGDRKDIGRLHEVQLDHPPYFLEGEFTPEGDLRAWSDARGGVRTLPLETRLDLMARTAEAVAAAHSVGVLHKDLKPGNILVYTADDGSPRPRITDFGIGVLMDPSLLGRHGITIGGFTVANLTENESSRTGTRIYAPPELLVGGSFTTQGDVYALGVMLYQMAVGDLDRPLASGWEREVGAAVADPLLRELLLGDIARMADGDPARRGSGAADVAERLRNLDPRRQALARERAAAAERADAERRVAEAHARRIRVRQLAALVVGVLVLLLGIAGIFLVRERGLREEAENARGREAAARGIAEAREKETAKARADAEDRARELRQVSEFQARMLEDVDAERMGRGLSEDLRREIPEALGRARLEAPALEANLAAVEQGLRGVNFTNLAVKSIERNVLEPALAAIDKEFEAQPLVQAHLLQTVAKALIALGLYDAATAPQKRALEIRRRLLGDDHPDTLDSLCSLGYLLESQGKLAEAEQCDRAAVEGCLRVSGEDHERTIGARNSLGSVLTSQGKLAEAEQQYRVALDASRRALGASHPITLAALGNLASLLDYEEKWEEGLELTRSAIEEYGRLMTPDDPNLLTLRQNFANMLMRRGRSAEAEPHVRDVLERRRRTLGDEHHDTLMSMNALGNLLYGQGKVREAAACFRSTLDGRRRTLGDDHPHTLTSMANMGAVMIELGELELAEEWLRASLEGRRRLLGPDHSATLDAMGTLGHVISLRGRLAEAEGILRAALEARARFQGENHPDTLVDLANLGMVLDQAGKSDEAEACLRRVLDGAQKTLGPDHPTTLGAMANLGAILDEHGKAAAAEPYLKAALEGRRRTLGEDHPDTLTARMNCASALEGSGKLAEAEAEYRGVLEARRRVLGDDNPDTLIAMNNLAILLAREEKLAEAEELLRSAVAGFERKLGAGHWRTAVARVRLANLLVGAGRFAEAEVLLKEAEPVLLAPEGVPPEPRGWMLKAYVALYAAWDRAEPGKGHGAKAEEWRTRSK